MNDIQKYRDDETWKGIFMLYLACVILVMFFYLLVYPADSIDLYPGSPYYIEDNNTSVILFNLTVQPKMISGQKVHFKDDISIEIFDYRRPYERSWVRYEIWKNGKLLDQDVLRGFVKANQTYRVYYPANGPYLVNLTGSLVSVDKV